MQPPRVFRIVRFSQFKLSRGHARERPKATPRLKSWPASKASATPTRPEQQISAPSAYEDVYQRLTEHDQWPTFLELDHDADRHGVEDPLLVMRSLSPTYLQGLGEAGSPAPAQLLSLSPHRFGSGRGWNEVARKDLELFTKSVQAAVVISDATTPPDVARFDALAS